MKYLKQIRAGFGRRVSFTSKDLRLYLSESGISRAYLHLLLHNLMKSGELKRITRGVYTFREEAEAVGFGFSPFYYGLQEALSLRNLWEQETNPVVITPKKARPGVRSFLGTNYVVRRISRKMFFGFEMMKYYDIWIPVSDAEKTLIDFVYFRMNLPEDALAEINSRMRPEVMRGYLKRCPARVAKRVKSLLGKTRTLEQGTGR
ncbi:type IV toxin-antitoxin system AbiEi family antitoxin domain-containing protein [Candidatus Micrarchaeota archaeon]|nr:type IV toxin-antitoxin system AbiEi family antitoxin domain-containing protein [Candidatus Micrarchaeota archaeon]